MTRPRSSRAILRDVDGQHLAQEEVVVADFLDADDATLDVHRAFRDQRRPDVFRGYGGQAKRSEFVHVAPGDRTDLIDNPTMPAVGRLTTYSRVALISVCEYRCL